MTTINRLTVVDQASNGDIYPISQAGSDRPRGIEFSTMKAAINAEVNDAVAEAVAAAERAEEAAASADAQVLRQDIADDTDPAKGAAILGWNDGTVNEYLDAGWYTPSGLDLTGATDESAVVLAALNKYKRVRLPGTPGGSIKLDIVIPSGCSLFGAGQQQFDRSALTWGGNGTLITGRIAATGSKQVAYGMMSIDSFALGINATQGTSDSTQYIYINKLTTRANNHGHLWEQNSVHADGRDGGDIVIVDCLHYGGPNGFVSKMRDVTFLRCFAYDVTVQAFVSVSDNINGADVYSRSLRTKFIDCGGDGVNEGLRIYSRDHFSLTNANNVRPCKSTEWSGTITNVTGRIIRSGDFAATASGDFTRVLNDDIRINGGDFFFAPFGAIRFENAARPVVHSGFFSSNGGSNGNHIAYGDEVYFPEISPSVQFSGATEGDAARVYVNPLNSGTLVCTAKRDLVILRNTSSTFLSSALNPAQFQKVRILIDDDFSIVTFTGVLHLGKGTVFEAVYDGSTWIDLGEMDPLGAGERVRGFATAMVLNWDNTPIKKITIAMSSGATSITAGVPDCPVGTEFFARLTRTNAGGKPLSGWDSTFKWTDEIPAPTVVPDGQSLLLSWYWDGVQLIAKSRATYAS